MSTAILILLAYDVVSAFMLMFLCHNILFFALKQNVSAKHIYVMDVVKWTRTTSAPIYTLHLYWKRFRLRPFTFTSKSRRCPTVNNRPLCLMLVGCCEYFIILPMSTVTYWNLKGDSSRLKIISKRRLAYETSMWDWLHIQVYIFWSKNKS